MSQTAPLLVPTRVRIGYWINRGWEVFIEDLGLHILIAVFAVIFVNVGAFALLSGPVAAGVAAVGLSTFRHGRFELKDFFDAFRYFLPALLSFLLILVFSVLGLIFLIVPGLVILAMYQFTFHFIVDRSEDFWQAMESSRKMVARDYFGFTVFGIVLGLLNVVGLLFLGVGILVSLPVTYLAMTAAYLDFTSGLPASPSTPPAEPVRIE